MFQGGQELFNSFYATDLLIPPENIRKPLVFWCFQGVSKEISGMKWVKFSYNVLLVDKDFR